MPLNPVQLESDLLNLCSAPPPTAAECAQAWGAAMTTYATGIVPPSTTVASAEAALVSALTAAFATPSAAAAMEVAFLAWATTVAGGMAPTYAGVPPAAPMGIATAMATAAETHAEGASKFADLIDAWAKTGTATLVAPPNTPVTWT